MANIVSAKTYLNDLEISADAPITTQLNTRIGGAINYLNDKTDALQAQADAIETNVSILKRYTFEQSVTHASAPYVITVPGVWQTLTIGLFATTYDGFGSNGGWLTFDRRGLQLFTALVPAGARPKITISQDFDTPPEPSTCIATIAYTSNSTVTVTFSGWPTWPGTLCGVMSYSGS